MVEDHGASAEADRVLSPSATEPVVSALSGDAPSRDPTALSYWFPIVQAAGLPVPDTCILQMPDAVQDAVRAILYGEEPDDTSEIVAFFDKLKGAAEEIGTPCFLRTDHTSGKHNWRSACFVEDVDAIESHVFAIAEYSEMASLFGLPYDVWVVRELLPTISFDHCPNFGGMPVCKEFRLFVDGETVECVHPYWPREALEQGGSDLTDDDFAQLCAPDDEAELRRLASAAGRALGGRWSVDLLATERGWFLTDMAEARTSYHWPGCPRDSDSDTHPQGGDAERGSVHG